MFKLFHRMESSWATEHNDDQIFESYWDHVWWLFNQPHVLTRSQFDLFELWHASNFQDISAILEAGGISYEDSMIEEVCKRMEGKQARQVMQQVRRSTSPISVWINDTVDGRNPVPPGMYKTL